MSRMREPPEPDAGDLNREVPDTLWGPRVLTARRLRVHSWARTHRAPGYRPPIAGAICPLSAADGH